MHDEIFRKSSECFWVYRNGDVRRRGVNVLPRAVHRESTAARRATSDARAHVVCFFFCLFICNFFKKCFFSPPSHRSDPTAASLLISVPGPCVFLLLSSYPSQSLVTRRPPPPFSFATQPPVNDTMSKPTHARGHIYSLAEVAKRKSLLSSARSLSLTPA